MGLIATSPSEGVQLGEGEKGGSTATSRVLARTRFRACRDARARGERDKEHKPHEGVRRGRRRRGGVKDGRCRHTAHPPIQLPSADEKEHEHTVGEEEEERRQGSNVRNKRTTHNAQHKTQTTT